MRKAVVVLLIVLLAGAQQASRAEHVVVIGGIEFDGTVHELDAKGLVHATSAAGKAYTIPAVDIISIDFQNRPVPADTVLPREFLFSNGDRIRAEIEDTARIPRDLRDLDRVLEKAQEITLKSPFIGKVKAKTEHLYAIIHYGKAEDLAKTPGFVEREAGLKKQDWIWLANGDVQQGRIDGFLKNEHDKVDMFYTCGTQRFQVGVFGVVAAKFQQLLPAEKLIPSGLAGVVTLVDGSVVSGKVLSLSRAAIRLEVVSGDTVDIAKGEALAMAFRNGRLVYLSPLMVEKVKDPEGGELVTRDLSPTDRLDLTPVSVKSVPYFSRDFAPRKDRSYGGNPITLGNRAFQRGIGTHSCSELTYNLDGRYERFESTIGIDSEVGRRGDVVFRIVLDGKEMLTDGQMKGGDRPRSVGIPVKAAKELKLIVDYGGDFDIADHADWGGACVIKAEGQ